MRVLVACEESQAVTIELRALGHEAYSCDIIPCSGGHPEWHIQGDVIPLLNGRCSFITSDGDVHSCPGRWDMIIGFPPCTYLTAASAVRLKPGGRLNEERYKKGLQAALFFYRILKADCACVAVENPVPMKCWGLPGYDQIIQPYEFGEPWRKRTCLWLRGLPRLKPTDVVEPKGLWVGSTSGRRDLSVYSRYELRSKRDPRERSKTFPGIAKAMAQQWAGEVTPV